METVGLGNAFSSGYLPIQWNPQAGPVWRFMLLRIYIPAFQCTGVN